MAKAKDPLFRYPAIHAHKVDEFADRLKEVYGAIGFDLRDPANLNARGNFVQLQDIALGFGACGTECGCVDPYENLLKVRAVFQLHWATRRCDAGTAGGNLGRHFAAPRHPNTA